MTEEVKDPQGLLEAYNKAKEDLVALRASEKEARQQLEALQAELGPEAEGKWKKRAVAEAIKADLANRGIKDPARILKLVDTEGVDFDDEGSLKGLEERFEKAKTDFPEVFDIKRRAGSSSADIHDKKPTTTQLTGSQAQVARLKAKQ